MINATVVGSSRQNEFFFIFVFFVWTMERVHAHCTDTFRIASILLGIEERFMRPEIRTEDMKVDLQPL